MTKRLGYVALAYLLFALVLVWGIGFLANISAAPTTVDGGVRHPAWLALSVDAALLLVFAVQHTVMARPWFKRRVPAGIERATFVLASGVALGLLFGLWQPVPATVWRIDAQPWAGLLWVGYALGWLIAIAATFMIDHLDFVGFRQARPGYRPPEFTERGMYALVRHPMMLGLLLAFWLTPRMSVGHLAFAVAASGYIAVGVRFEERGLRRELGPAYDAYAARVPAVVPGVRAAGRAGARSLRGGAR